MFPNDLQRTMYSSHQIQVDVYLVRHLNFDEKKIREKAGSLRKKLIFLIK